jgi:hypothetical protein
MAATAWLKSKPAQVDLALIGTDADVDRVDPDPLASLVLLGDVAGAGRVVADQDGGQSHGLARQLQL